MSKYRKHFFPPQNCTCHLVKTQSDAHTSYRHEPVESESRDQTKTKAHDLGGSETMSNRWAVLTDMVVAVGDQSVYIVVGNSLARKSK